VGYTPIRKRAAGVSSFVLDRFDLDNPNAPYVINVQEARSVRSALGLRTRCASERSQESGISVRRQAGDHRQKLDGVIILRRYRRTPRWPKCWLRSLSVCRIISAPLDAATTWWCRWTANRSRSRRAFGETWSYACRYDLWPRFVSFLARRVHGFRDALTARGLSLRRNI